jgi:hypothetical protein
MRCRSRTLAHGGIRKGIGQRLHAMMMQAAEPTLPVAANSEADTSTTTQAQMWKVLVVSREKLLFDDKMASISDSMPGPFSRRIL